MELVDENEGYGSEDENTNGIVNFLEDEDILPFSLKSAAGPSTSDQSSKTQPKLEKKKPEAQAKDGEKPDGFWMGSVTKSSEASTSAGHDASKSKYGGKKSAKARRYVFEDEGDFNQEQQEAKETAKPTETSSQQQNQKEEKVNFDDLMSVLSKGSKPKPKRNPIDASEFELPVM